MSLLNEPLIDLGLGIAFGDGADFSNITPTDRLFMGKVGKPEYGE